MKGIVSLSILNMGKFSTIYRSYCVLYFFNYKFLHFLWFSCQNLAYCSQFHFFLLEIYIIERDLFFHEFYFWLFKCLIVIRQFPINSEQWYYDIWECCSFESTVPVQKMMFVCFFPAESLEHIPCFYSESHYEKIGFISNGIPCGISYVLFRQIISSGCGIIYFMCSSWFGII